MGKKEEITGKPALESDELKKRLHEELEKTPHLMRKFHEGVDEGKFDHHIHGHLSRALEEREKEAETEGQ